ncbi:MULTISPECIES: EscC/YscC/HrcC family type III secretion system outer membrane ring protein [Chromobacterium]|uniref:Type 3 secretion system secretin n=1 Tax=Chromobacterium violaceum (strain ATCC 12472 / DSM 30191 / JCM 1249 / CCUG 213 / NBRC 12614 / NCIMB 9131 / NCTC 9757 / MK) TaxID=243365 RepID=Q7NUV0_CHRVO|nr:EscC/YscC/HrcC family type III secretion system outer membrane ring protein [Chromobacterium violaceum]AAQ60267.1 type III secretion system EscC protein [Chromobacterium violaceum ATCC 12472]SUX35795.1 outer membrane secretin SsaC [Chromobacterium violaceum]
MRASKWLGPGLVALTCAQAFAAIPWQSSAPFFLSTRGSKLADVLRDLGANYSVPVVVSKQVDEPFIGAIRSMPPEQALDQLARLHKLAWYYDGQAIYVYKAQEVSSQLITPAYLQVSTLISQLQGSGILDRRYCRVRAVPASNAMEVHGVPICLNRVEQLAKRIDEQKLNHEQNQEIIQLFPLKYATAADGSYSYRGQQVAVPGVVSVLKDMAQGRTLPLKENQGQQPPTDRSLPMFSADPRQNAVIVRDRKINMPLYASLIEQFDRKPALIEVSVMIIDVNSQDLSALGIDWSASASIGGNGISFNSAGQQGSDNFSTVISNTGGFMVKLNALQQKAKAQILSRPSVVTLDNTQAVLDRNITFYTKLLAEKVAKLESISTGSLLRVTPRLVDEGGQRNVMLTLVIQDGRQAGTVSQHEPLPQTLNAEVSTQTLLKAGQSLLLGGFVQDEHSEGESKIPLLGDIPLIGKLFRSTQKNSRSTVRLFLIKAEPAVQS